MSRAADPPVRNEGRRGSRIDLDQGGGYHGIPPQSSIRAFPSVQRIGCGTWGATGSVETARNGQRKNHDERGGVIAGGVSLSARSWSASCERAAPLSIRPRSGA